MGPPTDYIVECPMGHVEHRTLWGIADAHLTPREFECCRWCGMVIEKARLLDYPAGQP